MSRDHHQPGRWTHDRPPSLQQFTADFPDDAACADWLAEKRWPEGFVCPSCGHRHGWKLGSKPCNWECAGCGRQTSVTAGTITHRAHLPLRTWFLAAHLVATGSNDISALQLMAKLGIGSCKSAWLLLHKLRRSMVDPDREPLEGMIEVDETLIIYRTKTDPVAGGQGRSHEGKILVAGAVECLPDGRPGRIRLEAIPDYSAKTLRDFVHRNTLSGSTAMTVVVLPQSRRTAASAQGCRLYRGHILLPRIHRAFSNLKRLVLGVYHGFRRHHVQAYMDKFVFRRNRRRHYRSAFDTLLGIGIRAKPVSYRMLVARQGQGTS